MPFYIRVLSILVFWYPSGDLEPILGGYRGTTIPALRVCQGQGYVTLAGVQCLAALCWGWSQALQVQKEQRKVLPVLELTISQRKRTSKNKSFTKLTKLSRAF